MILVFCILGMIIFICFINLILILSNVKLKIENLHIFNTDGKVKIEVLIIISIYLLNRVKILNIKIDKDKLINKLKLKDLNLQKIREDSRKNKQVFKNIAKLDYKIEYLRIEGYFGTFNAVLSSNIFLFIHSVLPILIAKKINGKYINNLKFLELNQNAINVNLNCIISTKIVNIINILHLNNKYLKSIVTQKKGGIDKHGRTSYRRVNAYSNE